MIGRLVGYSARDARLRATELLGAFDLSDSAGRIVKRYPGGMRRRLNLAARLVGRPRFLYLDEPTTGLDPRSRLELWEMIRTLVAEGTTALLTTRYLDKADKLADEIVVVDRGRVTAAGTSLDLKSRTGGLDLEVRPTDPQTLAAAARILAEFDGDGTVHADGQVVPLPVADRSCAPYRHR